MLLHRSMMSLFVAIVCCTLSAAEPTPMESAADEIEALRREVAEASLLRDEVESLRAQLESLDDRINDEAEDEPAPVLAEDLYVPTVPFAASQSLMPPAGMPSATRGSELVGSY